MSIGRLLLERQLHALRDVANIGARRAASTLSHMIELPLMITVPRVSVARLADMPPVVAEPEQPIATAFPCVLGQLTGSGLLVFPRVVAARMCELLLRKPNGSTAEFGKAEEGAIGEVGTVLSSAYMRALSVFTDLVLLGAPCPSRRANPGSSALIEAPVVADSGDEQVFCMESEFIVQTTNCLSERLLGFFLLLPDAGSLAAIVRAARVR